MKLLRATFLSIRGLPDITCDFGDPVSGIPNDMVVVTGPPSSGKTRLLEAILAAKEVLAPYGTMITGESWIREGETAAKIELTWGLDADEQRMAGLDQPVVRTEALFNPRACRREADDGFLSVLEKYDHDSRYGKIEYLPSNRTLPPPGHPHGLHAIEQRLWRITRDVRKYSFVPRLLMELSTDATKAARFAAALGHLCPTVTYVGPTYGEPLRCFSSNKKAPVPPHELSTTEGDAVLIASTATLINFEKSILFVDRPENSADERSITEWAKGLRALAKDVQILFASSSAALVGSLDSRSVLNLGA